MSVQDRENYWEWSLRLEKAKQRIARELVIGPVSDERRAELYQKLDDLFEEQERGFIDHSAEGGVK